MTKQSGGDRVKALLENSQAMIFQVDGSHTVVVKVPPQDMDEHDRSKIPVMSGLCFFS